MKNFDLEAAKRGAAVCTRDGRGVVPVTVNYLLQGPYVFSGIISLGDNYPDKRVVETWTEHGLPVSQIIGKSDLSLMMRDDDYLEMLERGEYGNRIEDKREMVAPAIKQNLNTDREYRRRVYAGQAMQSEISGCLAAGNGFDGDKAIPGIIAKSSVMIADALIEELEKTEENG